MERREDSAHEATEAMIVALTLTLRRRGVHISPADAAAAIEVLRGRHGTDASETTSILQAILARGPSEAQAVAEACSVLLAAPSTERDIPEPPPPEPPPPPPPNPLILAARHLARKLKAFLRPVRRAGPFFSIVAAIAIVGIAAALLLQPCCGEPAPEVEPRRQPGKTASAAFMLAIAIPAATALTVLAFLVLRRRRRNDPANSSSRLPPPPPPRPPALDGSVFRAGALGGPPPQFINPTKRAEIAALFGYREAGADVRRLDVRATIAMQIREADTSAVAFAKRRELPTVLALVDSAAEGQAWNTLADEFGDLLRERGIHETRIIYPGSLHRGLSPIAPPRPEGQDVIEALAAPGWTMTVVFGEARGLSRRDRDLLGLARENGPLLFLEMRDPALWDARNDALTAAGIDIRPATADGLASGLARVFAPHLARTDGQRYPRGSEAIRHDPTAGPWRGLPDGPHMDWASECALVEPCSFSLAERFRCAHEELRTPAPSLDFSRLSALPGSWLGAEGLRFDASVRRRLLSHFAARPLGERDAALAILDECLDSALGSDQGTGAHIARNYIGHAARLIGLSSDESWQAIKELRRMNLLAKGVAEPLLDRLEPGDPNRAEPDAAADLMGGSDRIVLRDPPETAEMRDWLNDRSRRGSGGAVPPRLSARWHLDVPDARLALEVRPLPPTAREGLRAGPTIAAFLSGGRHILVGGGPSTLGQDCHLADLIGGRVRPLARPVDFDGIVGITAARDAPVALVFARDGRVLRVDQPAWADEGVTPELINAQVPAETVRGALKAVLTPDGSRLYFAVNGALMQVDFAERRAGGRPVVVTSLAGTPTALTIIGDHALLVGFDDGRVDLHDLVSGRTRALTEFGAAPLALSGAGPIPSALDGFLLAATTAAGKLALSNGEGVIEHALAHPAARIALLPHRPCIRTHYGFTADTEAREAGQSIAVLYENGGLDVFGLPDPSSPGLFRPMSILDRRLRGRTGEPRAIGLGQMSRRVALFDANRISVRTLIYDPPPPLAASDDTGPRLDLPAEAPA